MNVLMYIKPTCPFCKKALTILNRNGIRPQIVDVAAHPGRKQEMVSKAGGRTTVPQIFFGDKHVGGCDDLTVLDKSGMLHEALGGK